MSLVGYFDLELKASFEAAIHTTKKSMAILSSIIKCHELDLRKTNITHDERILYLKIREHRYKYYLQRAIHLTAETELESEQNLDRRSVLFALEVQGMIVASLRLTPRPFEIESFGIHQLPFETYNRYAELGRLVSDPQLDQISIALLARYLLCYTGLFAIEKYHFAGFVAICRPFRLSYFKKFGLRDHFTIYHSDRKMTYHFLSATMSEILTHTACLQINEEYLIKRLQKSFKV